MSNDPRPVCLDWEPIALDVLRKHWFDRYARQSEEWAKKNEKVSDLVDGVLRDLADGWDSESALVEWQQDRCAVCGRRSDDLVLDHDHSTDLIRGLLCRSCNCLEGHCSTDYAVVLFKKYRERCPAIMLGIVERYSDLRPEAFHNHHPVEKETDAERWERAKSFADLLSGTDEDE